MIQGFKDKDTRALFSGRPSKKHRPFRDQAEKRLTVLDSAERLEDLAALPSNRLEALSGNRKGQYSIRINRQWRVCFRLGDNGPFDVEIADYH